jgi:hypothetical protein
MRRFFFLGCPVIVVVSTCLVTLHLINERRPPAPPIVELTSRRTVSRHIPRVFALRSRQAGCAECSRRRGRRHDVSRMYVCQDRARGYNCYASHATPEAAHLVGKMERMDLQQACDGCTVVFFLLNRATIRLRQL